MSDKNDNTRTTLLASIQRVEAANGFGRRLTSDETEAAVSHLAANDTRRRVMVDGRTFVSFDPAAVLDAITPKPTPEKPKRPEQPRENATGRERIAAAAAFEAYAASNPIPTPQPQPRPGPRQESDVRGVLDREHQRVADRKQDLAKRMQTSKAGDEAKHAEADAARKQRTDRARETFEKANGPGSWKKMQSDIAEEIRIAEETRKRTGSLP